MTPEKESHHWRLSATRISARPDGACFLANCGSDGTFNPFTAVGQVPSVICRFGAMSSFHGSERKTHVDHRQAERVRMISGRYSAHMLRIATAYRV
ncbi:MAG: hypothetical protein WAN24_07400 [Candidatus Acidiferrales bacterium]